MGLRDSGDNAPLEGVMVSTSVGAHGSKKEQRDDRVNSDEDSGERRNAHERAAD